MLNYELITERKRYSVRIIYEDECLELLERLEEDGWRWANGDLPTSITEFEGNPIWYVLDTRDKRITYSTEPNIPRDSTEISLFSLLSCDQDKEETPEEDEKFSMEFERLIGI